jgi:hypothetical protein
MTIIDILKVETEMKRFQERMEAAKTRIAADSWAVQGCKETGALKRAAMDLKNCLTTLTK